MPLSQTFRRLNIINLTFWPLTFHHAERALLPRSNDGPLGRWVRGLVASGLAAGALASGGRAAVPPDLAQARSVAVEHIRPDHLLSNIKTLASDEFAGRAPASVGEERTVGFLVEQFKALGLESGNPDGSFLQNVPLMGVTGEPTVTIRAGGKPLDLVIPRDDRRVHATRLSQGDRRGEAGLGYVGRSGGPASPVRSRLARGSGQKLSHLEDRLRIQSPPRRHVATLPHTLNSPRQTLIPVSLFNTLPD